jgi:hypothetical protein
MSILAWIEDRRKQKLKSGLDHSWKSGLTRWKSRVMDVVTHVVLFFILNI